MKVDIGELIFKQDLFYFIYFFVCSFICFFLFLFF